MLDKHGSHSKQALVIHFLPSTFLNTAVMFSVVVVQHNNDAAKSGKQLVARLLARKKIKKIMK